MTDALMTLPKVLAISLAGLILAGWHSAAVLVSVSRYLEQFHDWAQLQIHARGAGLTAYKDAHAQAIRAGLNAKAADVQEGAGSLEGAAEGLRAELY